MPKITFLGAGSTIFARNILGDCMCSEILRDGEIALYDIDPERLKTSQLILDRLNANINESRATIQSYLGPENRPEALRDADFIVNAIQVGGYEPSTVIDFEIPKKYGLRQTIADTLGIGGIFRALRTIPVMLDFARDIEEVCPEAWMLNYVNPMAMITGAVLHGTNVQVVGLCHSVQGCARGLLKQLGMGEDWPNLKWTIAGINHMAWLLEIHDGKTDLYPEIRKRAAAQVAADRAKDNVEDKGGNMIRLDLIRHFGHYVTESSEHNAEYMPYWIKSNRPELIDEYKIPLDEYPRRCIAQIEGWEKLGKEMLEDKDISHKRTHEFGSYIMEAIVTDKPTRVHGNILNRGFIPNLPDKAVVEVPCLVDRNGVQGCYVGELPEQLAGLNRTNINVQLMTIEAALTGRKDAIYQAAYLDPHTAAELTLDEIRDLCDDLIEAHGDYLPAYK
jgi:alpha-galactosidase